MYLDKCEAPLTRGHHPKRNVPSNCGLVVTHLLAFYHMRTIALSHVHFKHYLSRLRATSVCAKMKNYIG